MTDIGLLTACELSQNIKDRKICPHEAFEHFRCEAEKKHPETGAFITLCGDTGLPEDAGTSALYGVPVAVKDNICTAGSLTTCGSKMLADYIPSYDADAVAKLRKAGLPILGKTNMDEFAMGSSGRLSAFYPVRNPNNAFRISGGSSSGSAAAVASGQALLALGTDSGGSIRQPSSYCGIVGFKPSYGRVSRYGLVAHVSSMDQIGPMGKNVSDVRELFRIISGTSRNDMTSKTDNTASELPGGLKIGFLRYEGALEPSDEVDKAVSRALAFYAENGAETEEVSPPYAEFILPVYDAIASAEAFSNLSRYDGIRFGIHPEEAETLDEYYRRTRTSGFGLEVKRRILTGAYLLGEDSAPGGRGLYKKACGMRKAVARAYAELFKRFDILISPTTMTTAPEEPSACEDAYTAASNLAGLPAISVPCGRNAEGMPIGLQIIGRPMADETVLYAAELFTAEGGGIG